MSDTTAPPPKPDYEIGYAKPPAQTRFSKGQSGNPKGRPKRQPVQDIAALFESVGQEQVSIVENGKAQRVSKLEATLRRQVVDALKGDTPAARSILLLALKSGLAKKIMQKSFIVITEPPGELGDLLGVYNRVLANQSQENE